MRQAADYASLVRKNQTLVGSAGLEPATDGL